MGNTSRCFASNRNAVSAQLVEEAKYEIGNFYFTFARVGWQCRRAKPILLAISPTRSFYSHSSDLPKKVVR